MTRPTGRAPGVTMNERESPELVCQELLRHTAQGWTLLGSRCRACGEVFFPAQRACAKCCGTELAEHEIGGRGTLWSWTIQSFLPKSPYNSGETEATFQPYGVGYVEMPSGLKVESRLTVAVPSQLEIGMPMELTLAPYRTTVEGRKVFTFAFGPCGSAARPAG